MDSSVGYLFAIIFFVLALNFYLMVIRRNRGKKRRKRMNRVERDEAKQALWRDQEIERRLEREQHGANERVKLREETLALYDEVRKRHADRERLENLGFSAHSNGHISSFENDEEPESAGFESMRLENSELDVYLADDKHDSFDTDNKVEMMDWNSYDIDENDIDPFDIFKKKKKK